MSVHGGWCISGGGTFYVSWGGIYLLEGLTLVLTWLMTSGGGIYMCGRGAPINKGAAINVAVLSEAEGLQW